MVASVFLVAFALVTRQFVAIPRRYWWRLLALGLTGIVLHNGLLYEGLEYTTATTASIILALIAAQVVILDLLIYRRWPDGWSTAGVIMAFTGAAWVLTKGEPAQILTVDLGVGELLAFLSGLSWALYSVLGRELLRVYSPLLVTTLASLIGVSMMLPFLAVKPEVTLAIATDIHAVGMIFFLGFLGSLMALVGECARTRANSAWMKRSISFPRLSVDPNIL